MLSCTTHKASMPQLYNACHISALGRRLQFVDKQQCLTLGRLTLQGQTAIEIIVNAIILPQISHQTVQYHSNFSVSLFDNYNCYLSLPCHTWCNRSCQCQQPHPIHSSYHLTSIVSQSIISPPQTINIHYTPLLLPLHTSTSHTIEPVHPDRLTKPTS